MRIFNNVLAVVVGTMVAMILVTIIEMGINKIYPLPPGTDMYDAASAAKAMAAMPSTALVLVFIDYAIAALVGGVISTILSKRVKRNPPLVTGFIMTIAGVYDSVLLHMPTWFLVANIFVYIPFAFLGYLLLKKRVATVD